MCLLSVHLTLAFTVFYILLCNLLVIKHLQFTLLNQHLTKAKPQYFYQGLQMLAKIR